MYKKLNREKVERFLKYCENKALLFDGAMGTQIQGACPDPSLFCGHDGFNEYLNITAAHIIENIHLNYLKNGASAVETNSFGANAIVMAEYGLGDRKTVYEISKLGAEIAVAAIKKHAAANPGEYFAAGSIGPSTKLPSLGHISFSAMAEAYSANVEGLIDGGADILIVETCQDILQLKCLLYVIGEAFIKKGFALPLMASVTLQQNGAMLVGTDISAICASCDGYDILTSIGFNCALGPFELEKHVETLSSLTNKLISAMPNAGLPENVGGRTVYKLTPDEFASYLKRFVEKYGVNIVGGCCGTTPEHIKKASEALAGIVPPERKCVVEPSVASLYSAWAKKQRPAPFVIGERTNANGSKVFREFLLKDDYDSMQSVAKNQQNGGAHAIDLCVAYVGRDEKKDMREAVRRFAPSVNLPLVIDSTDPDVIETALMSHGGKCIINSINLEDGGAKLKKIVGMAKKYNASVIALTIDEEGMAKTCERKTAVAKRIYDICSGGFDLAAHDLIFDPLTFTIGSGDESLRDAAAETIKAIGAIKKELPGCYTSLGVSNISFGLKPAIREIINSVFLKHSLEAGLDMAIINPAGMIAYHKIEKSDLDMVENLIFNRWNDNKDPLLTLLKHFDEKSPERALRQNSALKNLNMSGSEKLFEMVVNGEKGGLSEVVESALKTMQPLEIINGPLINAMKKVGELFGAGVMQLPFVLQSAEVMKKAVEILEARMEKSSYARLGKMVLATVSGDVHDIGKNLVDIILTNNGFEVFNLGIKVPIEEMIAACEKKGANILGMSGLLVRSTQIMRENLIELERRNLKYDVILGGAALNRKYVEEELSGLYSGRVFYAEDAFSGLKLMKSICTAGSNMPSDPEKSNAKPVNAVSLSSEPVSRESKIEVCRNIPAPPFLGRQVVKNIDPADVYPYINKTTLYRGQWQYKRGNMNGEDYQKLIAEKVEPLFKELTDLCRHDKIFDLKAVYGYYPCAGSGDSIKIFDPADPEKLIAVFDFPRQKIKNGLCVADFVMPEGGSVKDLIAMCVVTAGSGVGQKIKKLYSESSYKDYLHLHGLSVEMAEALTEYMHYVIRKEMGILEEKAIGTDEMVNQKYRGSRYSFGYPACPDLSLQKKLFNILRPDEIGVELTESFEMVPEQSTSAIVLHHPMAKYFAI